MEIRRRRPPPVDLETCAELCLKCADQLKIGRKDHRAHCPTCPRSRNYKGPLELERLSSSASSMVEGAGATHYSAGPPAAGSVGAAVASAAAAAATAAGGAGLLKRKRAQSQDDEEEEDVDIGGGGKSDAEDDDDESTKLDPAVPRRIGNSIDFPLSNLREHLICSLCRGYFRDPYTVADCLHTFCRSCLILFFRQGMRCCPTCNTRLGPDPFHTSISIQSREVIPDRTLQEVVNKIFPWMKSKDEEDEKEFYALRGIELKPEYALEDSVGGRVHHAQLQKAGISSNGNNSQRAANDMLELHLEPSDEQRPHLHRRLPPLRNSYLCMSGRTKIVSLKKYLVQKLGLKESRSSIELLCNGDPMGDELSLTFILRTRWFLSNKVLTLHYRLEDEENSK